MFAVRVKNEIQKAEGGVGAAIKAPSLNTSVKAPSGGTGNFSSSSPQVQNQTPKGISNAAKTPSSLSSTTASSPSTASSPPKSSNPLPSPSSLSKPVSFAPTNTKSGSESGATNKPASSFSAPKVEPINTGFTPQKQNVSPNAAKPANSPILTSMAGEQKLDTLLGQKNITKPDNPSSTSANTPSAPPKAGQTGTGQLFGGAKPNKPPSSAQGAMKTQPFSSSIAPNTAATTTRLQGGKGPSIVPPSQSSPQDVAAQAPTQAPTLSSLVAGKPEAPKPTDPNQKAPPVPISFAPQAKQQGTRLKDPSAPDALSRVAPEKQKTGGELGDMPRDIQVGMDGKQYVVGETPTPTAPASPNLSSGAKQAASSGFQSGQRFSNMLLHGSGSELFTAPTQAAQSALQRQANKEATGNQEAQNTYQTQQKVYLDQMKQHQQQLNQAKNAQEQAFKGGSAMLRVSFVSQENQGQQDDQQDLIKGLDSIHKAMFRRVNFDVFGAGSCGEYFGTPFYAKALELAAKQERLNAERAKLNLLEDEGKADKGFKKLQQKSCELDMQGSLLRAELLEYHAKAVRQDDKTQKSLKAASVPRSWQGRALTGAEVQKGWSEDYQSKLKPFVGTPFYAKALECIAEIEKARSAMEAYWLKERTKKDSAAFSGQVGGYNEFGLNFRESKKKKESDDSEYNKLRQAEGEADLAFANMQAEFFKWAAENLRKQDTAQKAHALNNLAKSLYPMTPDQYTGIGSTFIRKDPFEAETQSRCEPMDVSQPFIPLDQAKAWLDAILEASR